MMRISFSHFPQDLEQTKVERSLQTTHSPTHARMHTEIYPEDRTEVSKVCPESLRKHLLSVFETRHGLSRGSADPSPTTSRSRRNEQSSSGRAVRRPLNTRGRDRHRIPGVERSRHEERGLFRDRLVGQPRGFLVTSSNTHTDTTSTTSTTSTTTVTITLVVIVGRNNVLDSKRLLNPLFHVRRGQNNLVFAIGGQLSSLDFYRQTRDRR